MGDGDGVEIIRSNKGGLKLIHKGYTYTVHKKRQDGGIRWRCTHRSLFCKGSISTGDGEPKVNMPHNHVPDPQSVAMARYKQADDFADAASFVEIEYDEDVNNAERLREQGADDSFPMQRSVSSRSSNNSNTTTAQLYALNRESSTPSAAINMQSVSPSDEHDDVDNEEVCLRWNSHHVNMKTSFPRLLHNEKFTDCTITTDSGTIKCHQLILSACSGYFENLLSDINRNQHPVIFMKNVKHWIMKALIDFMYIGEILIEQFRLPDLMELAESLQVKGLTNKKKEEKVVVQHRDVALRKQNVAPPKDDEATSQEGTQSPMAKGSAPSPNAPPSPNLSPTKLSPTKLLPPSKLLPSKLLPAKLLSSKPLPQKPVIIAKMPVKSDPMSLLEPAFFEEVNEKDEQPSIKKPQPKKMKKRKPEYEPPVPLFMLRKGTKSRPNVKMPKHYHNDYEPFTLTRLSSSDSNEGPCAGGKRSKSTVPTPKRHDVIVKLEAPDLDADDDEDNSMDMDPLELPPLLHSEEEFDEDSCSKLSKKGDDEELMRTDGKEAKPLPPLKIIKLNPDSLLKSNQIKVVHPAKLKQSNSGGGTERKGT